MWATIRAFDKTNANTMRHNLDDQWMNDFVNKDINTQQLVESQRTTRSLPITVGELPAILNRKKETAPGLDNFTIPILKNLPNNMIQYLVDVYNKVLEERIQIPAEWKNHLVIPLLKPGKNPSTESSYRPIALSSCVGKLFESILQTRIDHHMESNKFLNQGQNRFRKSRGAQDNIIQLTTDIYTGFMSKKITIAVFLDIKRAFDNIKVKTLIQLFLISRFLLRN